MLMLLKMTIKTIIKMLSVAIKYKIKSVPDKLRSYWYMYMTIDKQHKGLEYWERAMNILQEGSEKLEEIRDNFHEEVNDMLMRVLQAQ